MAAKLDVLLALRRAAEDAAKLALGEAARARLRAEEEQARLERGAEQARLALAQESKRRSAAAPPSAAEGVSRERYRRRLAEGLTQATEKSERHRKGPLAQAQAAENAAAAVFRQANQERQGLDKLIARQEASQQKQTKRRVESAHDDWVHASRHKPRA
jgi:hypothetical protein